MTTQEKQEQQPPQPTPETTKETPPTEENILETMEQEIEAEEKTKPTEPETHTEAAKPEESKPEEEAEIKPKRKKKEEEIVEEKTYTIPLGKALIMPPRKRAPRAMHLIRAHIIKHMKIPTRAEEEDEQPPTLTITKEVNERIWDKGIEKPPRKIRVKATKDKEGNVTVHLAEGE